VVLQAVQVAADLRVQAAQSTGTGWLAGRRHGAANALVQPITTVFPWREAPARAGNLPVRRTRRTLLSDRRAAPSERSGTVNKRTGLVIAGVAGALVMAGGTAFGAVSSQSSIPGTGGLVTGCYQANGAGATNGTPLNIIDANQASCGKNQTSITWNQTGPAGPQGPQGPQGATGPAGPGLTFTATLGGVPGFPGPQLTKDGTYFVDAEVVLYNSDPVDPLIGNCTIGGQQNGEGTTGFHGTFMLPPNGERDMSFTGIMDVRGASITAPVTLLVGSCENTVGGILSTQPVVQVVWYVAPVASGN
jgi:hypothetical protein